MELVGVSRELASLANDLDLDLVVTKRGVLRQHDVQEPGLGIHIGSKDTDNLLGLQGDQEDVDAGTAGGLEGLGDRPSDCVRGAEDQVAAEGLVGQFDGLGLEDSVLVLALEGQVAGLGLADLLLLLLYNLALLLNRLFNIDNRRERHLGFRIGALLLHKNNALDERTSNDGRSTTLEDGQEQRISTGHDFRAQVNLGRPEASGDIATEENGFLLFVVEEGDIHCGAFRHEDSVPVHCGERIDEPEGVGLGRGDIEAEGFGGSSGGALWGWEGVCEGCEDGKEGEEEDECGCGY